MELWPTDPQKALSLFLFGFGTGHPNPPSFRLAYAKAGELLLTSPRLRAAEERACSGTCTSNLGGTEAPGDLVKMQVWMQWVWNDTQGSCFQPAPRSEDHA